MLDDRTGSAIASVRRRLELPNCNMNRQNMDCRRGLVADRSVRCGHRGDTYPLGVPAPPGKFSGKVPQRFRWRKPRLLLSLLLIRSFFSHLSRILPTETDPTSVALEGERCMVGSKKKNKKERSTNVGLRNRDQLRFTATSRGLASISSSGRPRHRKARNGGVPPIWVALLSTAWKASLYMVFIHWSVKQSEVSRRR